MRLSLSNPTLFRSPFFVSEHSHVSRLLFLNGEFLYSYRGIPTRWNKNILCKHFRKTPRFPYLLQAQLTNVTRLRKKNKKPYFACMAMVSLLISCVQCRAASLAYFMLDLAYFILKCKLFCTKIKFNMNVECCVLVLPIVTWIVQIHGFSWHRYNKYLNFCKIC